MSADQAVPRIRVVVVDDQELFVYGLRMLIESQPDLELVGSAGDGAEAVALVDRVPNDVVLMDIRMPVLNGIEATLRITRGRGEQPGPRVIVLTTFQHQEAVYLAMKHGASAFVTKDVTPEVLLETIRAVHAGDAPPAPLTGEGSLGALLRRHAVVGGPGGLGGPEGGPSGGSAPVQEKTPDTVLAALSPREREIFVLAAKGLRNADIAAAAFVSEATVKTHIRSILGKLGIESRAQIVVHAYESGLLG